VQEQRLPRDFMDVLVAECWRARRNSEFVDHSPEVSDLPNDRSCKRSNVSPSDLISFPKRRCSRSAASWTA
jgi:hypothetical protein